MDMDANGKFIKTFGAWHLETYGIAADPVEPYEVWQKKFTAYIATKPKQFQNINRLVIQSLFDKATAGVIAQGCPSFIGKEGLDSSVAYISYREGKLLKCPIGHIISDEQIEKYNITPAKFVTNFDPELIKELIPNSGDVCSLHFLIKLQRAHTEAYILLKRSKGKSDFVADYKALSNVVARSFGLKELE